MKGFTHQSEYHQLSLLSIEGRMGIHNRTSHLTMNLWDSVNNFYKGLSPSPGKSGARQNIAPQEVLIYII